MPFDVNAAQQFLTGFLGEQEKIKNQKKIDKLLESGKYKISAAYDGQGNVKYQLEDKAQPMSDFDRARLEMEKNNMVTRGNLLMASKGFIPTQNSNYTPQEFSGLPLDKVNASMPVGGFKEGQGLPPNPNVQNIPGVGMFKPGPANDYAKLKEYISLRNAMNQGKPSALDLKKLAQAEAMKRMGGSMLAGVQINADPRKKKEYEGLVEQLYQGYVKEFGVKDSTGSLDIENTDNTTVPELDTNWDNLNF